MASMSVSDAAPLPRLGEVFFDVRGSSRSMRLSWYADTGIAVFSIWQGGTCTGTFRLPMDDLPRLMDSLRRGMPADPAAGGQEAGGGQDPRDPIVLGAQRPRLAIDAAPAEPFTGAMTALPDDHAAGHGGPVPGYGAPANGAAGYGADAGYGTDPGYGQDAGYPAAAGYGAEAGYGADQRGAEPAYLSDYRSQQQQYPDTQRYGNEPGYDAQAGPQSYPAAASYSDAPAYPQPQSYPDAPAYSEPGPGGSQAYGYQGQAYEGQGYDAPGYDAQGYDDQGYAAPGRAEQVSAELDPVGSFGNRGYNVYDQTGQGNAGAPAAGYVAGTGGAAVFSAPSSADLVAPSSPGAEHFPHAYREQPGYPETAGYPQAAGVPQAAGYPETAGYPQAAGYSPSEASPDGAGYGEAAPDPAYPAYPEGNYGAAASYPDGSTYSATPQSTVPTFTPTFSPSGPASPGYQDGAGYQGQAAGHPEEHSHAGVQSYGAGGYPAGYPSEPQAVYPSTPTFTPVSPSEQTQRGHWSGDPLSADPQNGRDSWEQGYTYRR